MNGFNMIKMGWTFKDQARCWELVIYGLETKQLTDMLLPRGMKILRTLLYSELEIMILND